MCPYQKARTAYTPTLRPLLSRFRIAPPRIQSAGDCQVDPALNKPLCISFRPVLPAACLYPELLKAQGVSAVILRLNVTLKKLIAESVDVPLPLRRSHARFSAITRPAARNTVVLAVERLGVHAVNAVEGSPLWNMPAPMTGKGEHPDSGAVGQSPQEAAAFGIAFREPEPAL
jgi:hypothetical protein